VGVALSALASKATGFPIAKRIVHSGAEVAQFMAQAGKLKELGPILIDRYLQDAIEVDRIKDGQIAMVINTTDGQQTIRDSYELRRAALLHGVPYYTTVAGGACDHWGNPDHGDRETATNIFAIVLRPNRAH
jgi:hypothetical protein